MIKKAVKAVIMIILILAGILLGLGLLIKYETSWRLSNVGVEESPDGKYIILFQEVGSPDFPFGSSHAKVTVYDGNKEITSFREDIADDGAVFRPDNYSVEWMEYGVVITFMGSEQGDREVEVFYDGRESFDGYTDEEIENILKKRYDITDVSEISKKPNGFEIRADGVVFHTDDSMACHDSYHQEKIKAMTEEVFPGSIQRSLSWDITEGDSPADTVYTPVISMHGPGKQDIDAFCSDICEWLSYCFEKLPYEEGKEAYTGFIPEIPGYRNMKFCFREYDMDGFTEDTVDFYNTLYVYINRYMDHEYDAIMNISGTDEPDDKSVSYDSGGIDAESTGGAMSEVTEDTIETWASYDPDAVCESPDGGEYALVPVDRALGSSYYVLLLFEEKNNKDSARLINPDPFNGHGGEAKFIAFPGDGRTGFAALSYSGGSQGMLFVTNDGGAGFEEVILPSPEISLPNGMKYNPFVMPEEAWEESGTIYLRVGQGSEGDYYNPQLDDHPDGIYMSEDNGKTFRFVREE